MQTPKLPLRAMPILAKGKEGPVGEWELQETHRAHEQRVGQYAATAL